MSHLNAPCHIYMRHVTYEWVMQDTIESCHIWIHLDKASYIWMRQAKYVWVMSNMSNMNRTCYRCLILHLWLRHTSAFGSLLRGGGIHYEHAPDNLPVSWIYTIPYLVQLITASQAEFRSEFDDQESCSNFFLSKQIFQQSCKTMNKSNINQFAQWEKQPYHRLAKG